MQSLSNLASGVNGLFEKGSSTITMLKGGEQVLYIYAATGLWGSKGAEGVADTSKARRSIIAICRLGAFARLSQALVLPTITNANGFDLASMATLKFLKPIVPFSVAGFGYLVHELNHQMKEGNFNSVAGISQGTWQKWACDRGAGLLGNGMAATWFGLTAYLNFRAGNGSLLSLSNYNLIDTIKYSGEFLAMAATLMGRRDGASEKWGKASFGIKSVRVLAMLNPLHKVFVA